MHVAAVLFIQLILILLYWTTFTDLINDTYMLSIVQQSYFYEIFFMK